MQEPSDWNLNALKPTISPIALSPIECPPHSDGAYCPVGFYVACLLLETR